MPSQKCKLSSVPYGNCSKGCSLVLYKAVSETSLMTLQQFGKILVQVKFVMNLYFPLLTLSIDCPIIFNPVTRSPIQNKITNNVKGLDFFI